jgi:hypothetical protein
MHHEPKMVLGEERLDGWRRIVLRQGHQKSMATISIVTLCRPIAPAALFSRKRRRARIAVLIGRRKPSEPRRAESRQHSCRDRGTVPIVGRAVVSGLRRFAHWFAHLLDDREPSRHSSLLWRSPDGEQHIFLHNHDGGGGTH